MAPFFVLEVLVVVVEATGFKLVARLDWRRSLKIALLTNLPTAALSHLFI